MHSFLVLWPSNDLDSLAGFLEEAERHGHRVHLPRSGSDPGAVETTDPALMLGALPERLRNHLRSGEWTAQVRFYGAGDLDIPSTLLSVCAEFGVGISVWRSIPAFA
jgi:hypothetical protein